MMECVYSRLSKKCQECPDVDSCNEKRKEMVIVKIEAPMTITINNAAPTAIDQIGEQLLKELRRSSCSFRGRSRIG